MNYPVYPTSYADTVGFDADDYELAQELHTPALAEDCAELQGHTVGFSIDSDFDDPTSDLVERFLNSKRADFEAREADFAAEEKRTHR